MGQFSGVTLPREEILENAFVLCPLAELAPEVLHPVGQRSYRALWQAYDQASQPLSKVDFHVAGPPDLPGRLNQPGRRASRRRPAFQRLIASPSALPLHTAVSELRRTDFLRHCQGLRR